MYFLREIADAHASGHLGDALARFQFACEKFQDGRLACAVRTHQPDPRVVINLPREIAENLLCAKIDRRFAQAGNRSNHHAETYCVCRAPSSRLPASSSSSSSRGKQHARIKLITDVTHFRRAELTRSTWLSHGFTFVVAIDSLHLAQPRIHFRSGELIRSTWLSHGFTFVVAN